MSWEADGGLYIDRESTGLTGVVETCHEEYKIDDNKYLVFVLVTTINSPYLGLYTETGTEIVLNTFC